MRPPLSPTSNNVKRASEKGASETSKKQRLGDTPQPSGAADQKPPPTAVAPRDAPEKKDVRPTELVGEEKPVGAEDVPEVTIVDEDEAWTRKGFLSKRGDVEATVAEAVAAVAKINGPKKKQNKDALEELKALEKKAADKTISTQDNRDFCKKWDLPLQGGKKEKIPGKLRTLLEKKQREMVGQQKLDGERAVLNTKLDLEMKACGRCWTRCLPPPGCNKAMSASSNENCNSN